MDTANYQIIVEIGHYLLTVGLTAAILFAPIPILKQLHRFWRLVLATMIVWGVVIQYRFSVEWPLYFNLQEDPMNDGVGENVAILIGGWLEPLIYGLVMISVYWTWRRYKKTMRRLTKVRTRTRKRVVK